MTHASSTRSSLSHGPEPTEWSQLACVDPMPNVPPNEIPRMTTLERAIAIATKAHAGQIDKAGEPYILHALRVMLAVETPEERTAAVLHDVVEDTDWTIEGLREEGFSDRVTTPT